MTDIGSFPVAHTLCGFCNFQISNGIMRNPKQVIRVKQKNFFDLNALALLSFSRSRHLIGTGDKHRPIEHPGWGVGVALPEKLGRGVRPASQNLYLIYDQNFQFSLP